jgi:acetyl esterase/lipase
MKPISILLSIGILASSAPAQVTALANHPYKDPGTTTAYEKERCVLDLYLPEKTKNFATLVWFHGGGLTGGGKDGKDTFKVATSLAKDGVAVVVPNYRLSPKAVYPAYIEDAAAAVAWTVQNIAAHGGDARRIFIGGHSAGGYLTLIVGMDARHLQKHGIELSAIAGLFPVSGQTMTHYTIRAERGLGRFSVTADEAAPVRYAAENGLPPMLVIWADNDMAARAEENAYLVSLLKGAKQPHITGMQIPDRTHGSVGNRIAETNDPARLALLKFMADPAHP